MPHLWMVGFLLVFVGALLHSYAEQWATTTNLAPAQWPQRPVPTASTDYAFYGLMQDFGIAVMALGGKRLHHLRHRVALPASRGSPRLRQSKS
jgi:uncharacterized membrane protein